MLAGADETLEIESVVSLADNRVSRSTSSSRASSPVLQQVPLDSRSPRVVVRDYLKSYKVCPSIASASPKREKSTATPRKSSKDSSDAIKPRRGRSKGVDAEATQETCDDVIEVNETASSSDESVMVVAERTSDVTTSPRKQTTVTNTDAQHSEHSELASSKSGHPKVLVSFPLLQVTPLKLSSQQLERFANMDLPTNLVRNTSHVNGSQTKSHSVTKQELPRTRKSRKQSTEHDIYLKHR